MFSSDSSPSSPSGSPLASTSSTTSSSPATSGERNEISPASTTSASKKTKLDENSMTIEIDKFLECSICLDFPASPIHSCDNGHVLCGRCAPKFVACPTCQDPTLRPNPLGEKLAREANKKMDCVNLEAGCKEVVLSTKFGDHLPRCYFREITCNYKGKCGLKVTFHEYTAHLEDVHNKTRDNGQKFKKYYTLDEKRLTTGRANAWILWGPTVVKFRGHQFILHAKVSRQSQLFFSWVNVMGDKDTGDSFIAQVKFHNKTSDKLGCAWRLQVLAFHDMPPNPSPSEAKLFEYSEQCGTLSVPMAAIRKWGTMDADQILRFGVTYEITDA